MSRCDDCRAEFLALEADIEEPRVITLDRRQPACRCQSVSVSEFSNGPVGPDEVLIRLLIVPQHVNWKKKTVRTGALSDTERHGFSVFRERQASDGEIRTAAERLVANARAQHGDKAGVFGVLRVPSSIYCQACALGEQPPAFCVYDTALAEAPSHAEVFQRVAEASDELRDARRKALFDLVKNEFVPVQAFRGGYLADLAPQEP